jgi:hypothetical protein
MKIYVPTGFDLRERANFLKLLESTPKFREFGAIFCLQNKNVSENEHMHFRIVEIGCGSENLKKVAAI